MIDNGTHAAVCEDLIPLFRRIPAAGRYAITLGGSHGKGLSDSRSDYDFRIYYDNRVDDDEWNGIMRELFEFMDKWRREGVEIDGVWPRDISEIESILDSWLSGNGNPTPMDWTVWGYHPLTDIACQAIVEDPSGVAQGWKDRLGTYPPQVKDAILRKNGGSLGYWRNDYHYRSKVVRRDTVFLASITSRLINDIMQVLYALNGIWFPGDGHNLTYARGFAIKPERLEERVTQILYPGAVPDSFERQYGDMMALIDDVLEIAGRG